jgi:outer membrane lipoprotein-sorting protein
MRKLATILCFLTVSIAGCHALADSPSATQPSLSSKSSIDDILDALDARGKNLQDFTSDVKLTETDAATGDATTTDGQVLFQRKPSGDSRILVDFTKKEFGDRLQPENHQYLLADGWLVERDYDLKKEIRRQVVKPGEKIDPLKLGEGAFPLPIGQSKEDVKDQFDVTKIDPAKDDPPNTVHLQLTPRPGSKLAKDFKTIDIWVDDSSWMPQRIQTLDLNQTTMKTTDLSNVKINVGLGDKDFTQSPMPAGSDLISEPLDEQ